MDRFQASSDRAPSASDTERANHDLLKKEISPAAMLPEDSNQNIASESASLLVTGALGKLART